MALMKEKGKLVESAHNEGFDLLYRQEQNWQIFTPAFLEIAFLLNNLHCTVVYCRLLSFPGTPDSLKASLGPLTLTLALLTAAIIVSALKNLIESFGTQDPLIFLKL